jgi:transcriptional regulator with XRE-family HTH domain
MEIKTIASSIKTIRELKKITREYIVAEMDMSVSGYSKIELGEVDLTISKIDKIATILEVSTSQILNFDATTIFNISNTDNNRGIIGNDNKACSLDDYTKKHIAVLEQEIERLKNQKES